MILMEYSEGDVLLSKNDYLDFIKKNERYTICASEVLQLYLNEKRFYLKDKNNVIVNKGWGLNSMELAIHFEKIIT